MRRQTILLIVINYMLAILAYLLLIHLGLLKVHPTKTNLLLMDAYWYDQMRLYGYQYIPNSMCNLAYFPLFPLIWKVTNLGPIGISLINALIFTYCFAILIEDDKYSILYKLVLISFPNFIFFIVPYSEALFFLFGTILILGYRKDSQLMICWGLFGCGLTRSVSVFFIPAIIITEFINYRSSPSETNRLKCIKNILLYSLTSGLSFFLVSLLQYLQTGKWFYFLQVQKYWGRHFQMPELPFTTNSPERILGIDAMSMIFGVIAAYMLIKWAFKSILVEKYRSQEEILCRSIIFSALYLASIVFLDCFFTDSVNGKTKIWSMNRHIMCTPYFICFLNYMFFRVKTLKVEKYLITVLIILGILTTELYKVRFGLGYYFIFFTTLFIIPMFPKLGKLIGSNTIPLLTLYFYNFFLFIMFYQSYLLNNWIG